jgi:hypothetical protein
MRGTICKAALVTIIALAAAPRLVGASEYPGWGDTGWVYASKRECCNAAIRIAQQYSMEACVGVGGVPRPMRGAARGSCEAQWMQLEDGSIVYRCVSESAVWCR